MILTEKDLQLLSSLPAPVPEEKKEMDLKIGEYWAYFILRSGLYVPATVSKPKHVIPKTVCASDPWKLKFFQNFKSLEN